VRADKQPGAAQPVPTSPDVARSVGEIQGKKRADPLPEQGWACLGPGNIPRLGLSRMDPPAPLRGSPERRGTAAQQLCPAARWGSAALPGGETVE